MFPRRTLKSWLLSVFKTSHLFISIDFSWLFVRKNNYWLADILLLQYKWFKKVKLHFWRRTLCGVCRQVIKGSVFEISSSENNYFLNLVSYNFISRANPIRSGQLVLCEWVDYLWNKQFPVAVKCQCQWSSLNLWFRDARVNSLLTPHTSNDYFYVLHLNGWCLLLWISGTTFRRYSGTFWPYTILNVNPLTDYHYTYAAET